MRLSSGACAMMRTQDRSPLGAVRSTSNQSLRSEWMAAHGTGQRSVAVLTSMVDYNPISISPIDAALVEMKKLSLVDVANAFCVPIFMVGGPSGHSNVYSNVETEQKALWTHTLQPWAVSIEATVNALLPRGKVLSITMPTMQEIVGWEMGKKPVPSVDYVQAAEASGALPEDQEDAMGVAG